MKKEIVTNGEYTTEQFFEENPDAEFDNYCQWIQKTNETLAEFLDKLEQSDEPTLVLFVGDHFPSLKGGSGIYDQLGINGDNCSVLYEQKYLLWSNYDADFSKVPQDKKSLYYMPYVIMDVIDAPRDSFIQKMFDYMETTFSNAKYDYVFTDIYHDISDAIEVYNKMKKYEEKYKDTKFAYWIENTIKAYI